MKTIREHLLLRIIVITTLVFSWLVLSNHCALSRLAGSVQQKRAHSCCENGKGSVGGEKEKGGQKLECCRSLHATLAATVDAPPASSAEASVVDRFAVVLVVPPTDEFVAVADTGPPDRGPDFAELVLHRSLRSHAPPQLS